jgi:hypothetical protein
MPALTGFKLMKALVEVVGGRDYPVCYLKHEGESRGWDASTRSSFEQGYAEATFNLGHTLGQRRLAHTKSMGGIGPGGCSCGFANVEELMDRKVR